MSYNCHSKSLLSQMSRHESKSTSSFSIYVPLCALTLCCVLSFMCKVPEFEGRIARIPPDRLSALTMKKLKDIMARRKEGNEKHLICHIFGTPSVKENLLKSNMLNGLIY